MHRYSWYFPWTQWWASWPLDVPSNSTDNSSVKTNGSQIHHISKMFQLSLKILPNFFHNWCMIEVLNNIEFYHLSVETWFSHSACWISSVWVACFILLPAWKMTCNRAFLGSKAQSQAFTTGCIFILCRGRNYFILFKEDLSLHQKPRMYSGVIRLSCTLSSHAHFLI